MTLLGLVGFLVLGFTILGGIGGGVLGIVLGRIVGKKIHKKNQLTDIQMTYFDILIIRVSCLLKWVICTIIIGIYKCLKRDTYSIELHSTKTLK